MIFVIAGNQEEAYQYINRKLEERIRNGEVVSKIDDYKYVYSIDTLRGVQNPSGVFIGSWRMRQDIFDIVGILRQNCNPPNKALKDIWKSLNFQFKGQGATKLKPVQGGWINETAAIEEAAKLLANEIDREVLENALKKINGGMNG